jgi:2-polyprenyl-6-methoxyphenol hydroxylase-like FAD-dependent oxidoreductase
MGVTKAGEDALALAESVARHGATPAALQAYEALRLAPGQAVVERGRRLGAYLQARALEAGQPARGSSAPHRDALSVLRETAIDLSLQAAETA